MTRFHGDWGPRLLFLILAALALLFSVFALESSAEPAHVTLPEPLPEVAAEPRLEPEPNLADVQHLAIAIYREAGGDAVCDDCRYRVGDVVLTRVADPRFPDTLEAVLTQRGQYGTMYWDGVTWPERASLPQEQHAVARAEETAYALLTGTHSDLDGQGYIFQSEFPDLGHSATTCCGIYYAKG